MRCSAHIACGRVRVEQVQRAFKNFEGSNVPVWARSLPQSCHKHGLGGISDKAHELPTQLTVKLFYEDAGGHEDGEMIERNFLDFGG